MNASLRSTVAGGCVLVLDHLDPGGHHAIARFLDPDYGPVEATFDGHQGAKIVRDAPHERVLVRLDGADEVVEVTLSEDQPVDPAELDTTLRPEEPRPKRAKGDDDDEAKPAPEAPRPKRAKGDDDEAKPAPGDYGPPAAEAF